MNLKDDKKDFNDYSHPVREKYRKKRSWIKRKKRNLEFMIMITTRKMEMLEVFQEIKF